MQLLTYGKNIKPIIMKITEIIENQLQHINSQRSKKVPLESNILISINTAKTSNIKIEIM